MTDPTTRLDALEEKLSHQEQAIEELNETITSQWQEIDRLKRELSRMTDQLRDVETALDQSGKSEPPPPHY